MFLLDFERCVPDKLLGLLVLNYDPDETFAHGRTLLPPADMRFLLRLLYVFFLSKQGRQWV